MRLDALANATQVVSHEIAVLTDRHAGARGIVQLRRAVELLDGGAESPQESRTRLLLIAAGFPRPQTQIVVCNEFGCFIGRVDMGWPEWKVGVEYDGPKHWASPADHARTIERIADLEAQGWIIIRITATSFATEVACSWPGCEMRCRWRAGRAATRSDLMHGSGLIAWHKSYLGRQWPVGVR